MRWQGGVLALLISLLAGCGSTPPVPISFSPNLPPLLFSIFPSSATAGGPGFTLTVNGTNFNALSVVRWNGADHTTTFVSNTQLTAAIPSSDIAVGGTADVTVFNPSPGVGTSSALTFTINATPLAVIERVSVDSVGTEANGNSNTTSQSPAISADGRFVAFGSSASNLVAGDTNLAQSIFVRDTCVGGPVGCTPSTIRVSVNSAGTEANSVSFSLSMSADGHFVAFASLASNLVAGDTNGANDIFVRDTCVGGPAGCTPSTIRVSVDSAGTEGNRVSVRPAISADGRFVAFASLATNLVAGDTNGATDVFVRDTCVGGPAGCTPSTIRVSVDSAGTEGNRGSGSASLSADGRFVAFTSDARNLVAGDTNLAQDIFVRDTCVGGPAGCTPSTIRVSVDSAGTEANATSLRPAISADGRFVAFSTDANNLVAGDINKTFDIFVRDTCVGGPVGCTPSTIWVSMDSTATARIEPSGSPSLSADGRFVAFDSFASNLVAGDTNGTHDIFVRDTCVGGPAGCTPSTIRASVDSAGTEGDSPSTAPSLSADGHFVAFASLASNLVAGDTNSLVDVFLAPTGF